jgi:hypothetical protein
MMLTKQKFIEMGFIILGATKIQDRYGDKIYLRKAKSPLKAIKQFCFECMGMDRCERNPPKPHDDVKNCTDPVCPVFDFRFGKNPYLKRKLSQEQREAAVKRLKTANR